MDAVPLLGQEVQGKQPLGVVHRLVAYGCPSEVASDDDAEGFRRFVDEEGLAEVDAVCVVGEDLSVGFGKTLERKGVTTASR